MFDTNKYYTIKDFFGPAMEITTKDDAKDWLEQAIEYTQQVFSLSDEEARAQVIEYLWMYARGYSTEALNRLIEIFNV